MTRCNATSAPIRAEATRRLVEARGQITVLPSVILDIPVGCETVTSRLTALPNDLPPGRYTMTGTFSSTSRWGRVVVVPWSTEPFMVEA